MTKPLGGRGKKAPYETVVIRVPIPLVPNVEQMIEDYRSLVISGENLELDEHSKSTLISTLPTCSEAIEEAKKIVKFKKSAAESLAKLLQVIYRGEITKEDLR
jgi:hypothetical protein